MPEQLAAPMHRRGRCERRAIRRGRPVVVVLSSYAADRRRVQDAPMTARARADGRSAIEHAAVRRAALPRGAAGWPTDRLSSRTSSARLAGRRTRCNASIRTAVAGRCHRLSGRCLPSQRAFCEDQDRARDGSGHARSRSPPRRRGARAAQATLRWRAPARACRRRARAAALAPASRAFKRKRERKEGEEGEKRVAQARQAGAKAREEAAEAREARRSGSRRNCLWLADAADEFRVGDAVLYGRTRRLAKHRDGRQGPTDDAVPYFTVSVDGAEKQRSRAGSTSHADRAARAGAGAARWFAAAPAHRRPPTAACRWRTPPSPRRRASCAAVVHPLRAPAR